MEEHQGNDKISILGIIYRSGSVDKIVLEEVYYDMANSRVEYTIHDHLGSPRVILSDLNGDGTISTSNMEVLDRYVYYPFGMEAESHPLHGISTTNEERYGNKERSAAAHAEILDYEARYYEPSIGRFLGVDPHASSYPSWSPYTYVFNNPLIFIDPDGRDPIYGKNFWGKTKLIGDDGKTDGKSYLVSGSVKKDVKKATKAGLDFTGSLAEGENVFNIPTSGVMDDVISSVDDTKKSQKENGGHANTGDANATRWDEGPAAIAFIDKNGNPGAKASLSMFKVGGKNTMPKDASNVEFWWHTHPKTSVNGIQLDSSTPSRADFSGQGVMTKRGFKGNTFVIGVRSGTVTFFNKDKSLITVSYSDFKKMGGK